MIRWMRNFFILVLMAWACLAYAKRETAPPASIGGIALGADVQELAPKLRQETDVALFRQTHFRRMAVKRIPGYRSGYVTYGTCQEPDTVVRIKLKYADAGEKFFERFKDALRDTYGKGRWQGDAFGTRQAWKWSFRNARNDSISLVLQRYTGQDDSYTQGNSIRLANRTAMDRETACARKQVAPKGKPRTAAEELPLEYFLPQAAGNP